MVDRDGTVDIERILPAKSNSRCSFERIYFSRGSDKDIYNERKTLGRYLVDPVLDAVDNDIDKTVFSFIPNTAEVAFYGLVEGIENNLIGQKIKEIQQLSAAGALTDENISEVLHRRVRKEKVAIKDIKAPHIPYRRVAPVMILPPTCMISHTAQSTEVIIWW